MDAFSVPERGYPLTGTWSNNHPCLIIRLISHRLSPLSNPHCRHISKIEITIRTFRDARSANKDRLSHTASQPTDTPAFARLMPSATMRCRRSG